MIDVQIGQELPSLEIEVTRTTAVMYAGASGDFNPIHHSDHAAQAVGMPQVIIHGMWTMGAALRVVTDWIGDPTRVVNYFVRFTKPLPLPDDGVGAKMLVTAKVSAVDEGLAAIAIEAKNGEEKLLGAAKAQVRLD
uniref:MaoC/PaaZ C-terminal domain-containing protein n=1 Tax=Propionimicrobium lymphophilum TaxID=33012 RepID=UPI002889FB66|nr:MaoC/PaaZ C-terminal domain-containing protein [Propionimicrobium lymphophilum]